MSRIASGLEVAGRGRRRFSAAALRPRRAWLVLAQRRRARDRLAAALRREELAERKYEAWPNDCSYERWVRSQVEGDDALAVVQEWSAARTPPPEARW